MYPQQAGNALVMGKVTLWFMLNQHGALLLQAAPPQTSSAQTPPAQPALARPFSADMEENATDLAGSMRDIKGKIYVSRPQMRMDVQQPGHPLIILLVNTTTRTTDMLYPEQHKYMEIKADPKNPREHGSGMDTAISALHSNPCAEGKNTTCRDIGTEQVNGRTCEHWQVTDKNGKVIGEVWLDKSLHIAIKGVSERGTRQLTNVKEGEPPASLFKIPTGYRRIDLGK